MGIRDYFINRRLEKLRGDLAMLEERYQFKAYKVYTPEILLKNSKLNEELIESLVWYSGDVSALLDLYKKEKHPHMSGSFWNLIPTNARKVHSGLPNLIVSKMPTIIMGAGYQLKFNVYNGNTIDEARSDKINELMEIIREELDLETKLMSAVEKESWSGHLGFKISINPDLSKLPIVEFFDRRYFDIVKARGITQAIIFKKYFEIGESKYLIKEIYTSRGKPIIKYEVYLLKDGKEVLIPIQSAMNYLPELQELSLNEFGEVEYEDLQGWLAFEKPNVIAKGLVENNPYGKSDITAFTMYDALDEVMSAMTNETRDNRTRVYIPESMIPKDRYGRLMQFDSMMSNYVKLAKDHDQNAKNEVTATIIPDKTEQHFLKFKTLVTNICNNSELSPLSLGLVGMDGLNNSDETLRERVKTTIEMREKKVRLWRPFLEKMYLQILMTYDYMSKGQEIIKGYGYQGLRYEDVDVNVVFNDYMNASQKELIELWGSAKQAGVATVDMAVRKIHQEDLTEEELQEEINKLNYSSGVEIESPDALELLGEVK